MDAALYARIYAIEDRYWWSVGTRAIFRDWLVAALDGMRPQLLDVGCGSGALARELTALGPVTAIDCSVEAVELSRRRGLARLCVAKAEALPFKPGRFDAVTAADLIEHTDDRLTLSEVTRVLKPGGLALVHVPAFPLLWGEHDEVAQHRRRYLRRSLVAAIEGSGLRIERLSYINCLLFPVAVCVRLGKRVWGARRGRQPQAEIYDLPPWLNRALTAVLGVERWMLRRMNFPFGVSLLCLARKGETGV